MEEITLAAAESRELIYYLNISGSGSTTIELRLSKHPTTYYIETLSISYTQSLEVVSYTFPNLVTQWDYSHLILKVQNNKNDVVQYTLSIVEQNPPIFGQQYCQYITGRLFPGENRIVVLIFSTLNPYEFGAKTYLYELRDSSGQLIDSKFFEVTLELSTSALFLCYIIPLSIPVCIALVYINKTIKNIIFTALYYIKHKIRIKHAILDAIDKVLEKKKVPGYPTYEEIKEKAMIYGIK